MTGLERGVGLRREAFDVLQDAMQRGFAMEMGGLEALLGAQMGLMQTEIGLGQGLPFVAEPAMGWRVAQMIAGGLGELGGAVGTLGLGLGGGK